MSTTISNEEKEYLDHDRHERLRQTEALASRIKLSGMTLLWFPPHLIPALLDLFEFDIPIHPLKSSDFIQISNIVKGYEASVNPAGPGNDPEPS